MRTKTLLFAAAALLSSGAFGAANATAIISTNVSAWTGTCPGPCGTTSATEQALPTGNPLEVAGNLVINNQSATGQIKLFVPNPGTNDYGHFFSDNGANDGLVFTPVLTAAQSTKVLSTGTYTTGTPDPSSQTTTLMEFTFTLPAGTNSLTITHDDGVSLFAHGDTTTNLDPGHSAPTNQATETVNNLAGGTYDLWYVEANGSPAILDATFTNTPIQTVPEPTSMVLFGTGLIALGLLRRRRKAA